MMVRNIIAFILGLTIVILFMPKLITFLKKLSVKQVPWEYQLEAFKKVGTPTMGGTLFVVSTIVTYIILNPTFYKDVNMVLIIMTFFTYALVGFIDDYIIVVRHNNDGLIPPIKFAMQLVLSIVFYLIYQKYCVTTVSIPFTNISIDLGWVYALLVFFMFTGSSNAVNLTDGMDGLAAGVTFISTIPFIYISINKGYPEIATFLFALEGSLLGYLKFNRHPASIFMGDAGSLGLGAMLAAVALVLKVEFALAIIGGVFVVETVIVIIQQVSVRLFHKKVFSYTPIHYAFTLKGWKETTTVYFFYACAIVCCILGIIIGVLG